MTRHFAAWAAAHEVIALEGCDGVGKTTLAATLARQHGYQLVHASRTPDGVDLLQRYRTVLARPGRLVLDRCFVSELVYGPLLHQRARLTLQQAQDLAAIIAGRGGLLIHLTGPLSIIVARLRERDGAAPDLDHIHALIDAYAEVFAALADHVPVMTFDITQAS